MIENKLPIFDKYREFLKGMCQLLMPFLIFFPRSRIAELSVGGVFTVSFIGCDVHMYNIACFLM